MSTAKSYKISKALGNGCDSCTIYKQTAFKSSCSRMIYTKQNEHNCSDTLVREGKPGFRMMKLGSSERIREEHKKQKVRMTDTCILVAEMACSC
jgi:hypothetical protein